MYIATLLGIYTIVELPLSFLVSFGILTLSVKNEAKRSEGVDEKETAENEELFDRKTEDENYKNNLDETGVNLESLEKGKDTKELDAGKEKKESFLWTASVCSTWIPAVVGDWKQKVFLKTGVTSIVLKSMILITAIVLSIFGYNLNPRPNLIWCLEESSPLIDQNSNVTYCVFGNDNSSWTSCNPDASNYTGLPDLADSLEQLEGAMKRTKEQVTMVEQSNLPGKLPLLHEVSSKELFQKVQSLKANINGLLRDVGLKGIVQKVRICGTNENQIRMWIFVVLGTLVLLATLATYRLHRISDYKVRTFSVKADFRNLNEKCLRSVFLSSYQVLFSKSETIGLCIESPKLQVE